MPVMPLVQDIVLPILRAALDVGDGKIGSWVEDIDHRKFPLVNVRRLGGLRHETRPTQLDLPVIELTVYGTTSLPATARMYAEALEALYAAVEDQTQTDAGYLHSIKETMGATQFPSPFQRSWRIQGLIQLGIRPPRSS